MRVLEVLADATNVIAEGEVLQLMNMHDPDVAVDDYLRVIRFKTAKLFEASARLGAVLAEADSATEEACAAYGRSLGTAFQLVDDLLDYEGATEQLGKNVGNDLREGKPTLPLLIAMERGTAGRARDRPPRDRARRSRAPGRDRRHRPRDRRDRRDARRRAGRGRQGACLARRAAEHAVPRRSARLVGSIRRAFVLSDVVAAPRRSRRRVGGQADENRGVA